MRPTRDTLMMESAKLWARRSTCSRADVGVVICTPDYRTLSNGYNGAPPGMDHCSHYCDCGAVEGRGVLPGGDHLSVCTSTSPCRVSVHAEANSIAFAARHGVRLQDAQLFSTVAPCEPCAQLILCAGITRVVYLMPHRYMAGVELLDSAGLVVIQYGHD